MWSGWLAATALWALVTVALVAEQVTCSLCWSWGSVFILTYIFVGVLVVFSLWPCVRYHRGFTSRDVLVDDEDVDDVTAERARIDTDRRRLGTDWTTVAFSFIASVLLLTFFIVLAVELDSTRAGNPPSYGGSGGVLIALLIFLIAVYLASMLRAACSRSQHRTETALSVRSAYNAPFASLWACCHTPAEDIDGRRRQRAPACFGDYPHESWSTTIYNIVLFVIGVLLIIAVALAIGFFNDARPADELGAVLWPVWTAIGLGFVASIILIGSSFVDGGVQCWHVFMVAFSLFVVIGALWSSIWLLQADSLPPHVIATPLYVVLGVSTIVYAAMQLWHCQRSYRIVDTHSDHHLDDVASADGVYLRDVASTSLRMANVAEVHRDSTAATSPTTSTAAPARVTVKWAPDAIE